MKKWILTILCCVVSVSLCGCTGNEKEVETVENMVETVESMVETTEEVTGVRRNVKASTKVKNQTSKEEAIRPVFANDNQLSYTASDINSTDNEICKVETLEDGGVLQVTLVDNDSERCQWYFELSNAPIVKLKSSELIEGYTVMHFIPDINSSTTAKFYYASKETSYDFAAASKYIVLFTITVNDNNKFEEVKNIVCQDYSISYEAKLIEAKNKAIESLNKDSNGIEDTEQEGSETSEDSDIYGVNISDTEGFVLETIENKDGSTSKVYYTFTEDTKIKMSKEVYLDIVDRLDSGEKSVHLDFEESGTTSNYKGVSYKNAEVINYFASYNN